MDELSSLLMPSAMTIVAAPFVLVAVIAIVWFFIASSNKRTLGMAYVLAIFAFEILTHYPRPYVSLGGLQAYPADILVVVLMVVVVLESFKRPVRLQGPLLLWLALGGLLFTSLALGLSQYGKSAGTESRDYVYFWCVGLYACTCEFDEAEMKKIAKWATWCAYGLIAIALYRWIGLALGFVPRSFVLDIGITSVFRALPSEAAFFLAAAALVHGMAWLRGTGSPRSGLHALIFAAIVVVLQHRSVWLATVVAGAVLMVQERKHLPRQFPWLLGFVLLAGIGMGIAATFGYLDPLFDALDASLSSVTASRSTVTDRMFGWESLLDEWANSSTKTLLFGFPYGHGWHRFVDGKVAEYSPHNFYVDMLLRVGVVGLGLLVLATLMALCYSLVAKVESEPEYLQIRGFGLILVASVVYYVPYSASYTHGAVTGLALAQIMHRSIRRRQQARLKSGRPTAYVKRSY